MPPAIMPRDEVFRRLREMNALTLRPPVEPAGGAGHLLRGGGPGGSLADPVREAEEAALEEAGRAFVMGLDEWVRTAGPIHEGLFGSEGNNTRKNKGSLGPKDTPIAPWAVKFTDHNGVVRTQKHRFGYDKHFLSAPTYNALQGYVAKNPTSFSKGFLEDPALVAKELRLLKEGPLFDPATTALILQELRAQFKTQFLGDMHTFKAGVYVLYNHLMASSFKKHHFPRTGYQLQAVNVATNLRNEFPLQAQPSWFQDVGKAVAPNRLDDPGQSVYQA